VVYGYRKDPWGVRGCISDDGLNWDKKDEFIIREGGVPVPISGKGDKTVQDMLIMAQYWHIGYPSATQLDDNTIVVAYHEYSDDERPIHYLLATRFKV